MNKMDKKTEDLKKNKKEILKLVKKVYGMPTVKQYQDFAYDLKNKVLREWAEKYGMTDMLNCIERCLNSGFGFIGETRIDSKFMVDLMGTSDESIINAGYLFLSKVVVMIDQGKDYEIKVA